MKSTMFGPSSKCFVHKSVSIDQRSFDVVLSSDRSVHRFAGKPVSQTTGLYYEYSGWYDTSIGRFIGSDSYSAHLSDPKSPNYYVYTENNPTGNTDPTGHFVIEALLVALVGGWNWLWMVSRQHPRLGK